MEQVLYFGFTLAFGAIMFLLGQRSVRLVGQRVEVQHPSDRRVVTEFQPVTSGSAHYAPPESPEPSMIPPPRYKDLVEKHRSGGDI